MPVILERNINLIWFFRSYFIHIFISIRTKEIRHRKRSLDLSINTLKTIFFVMNRINVVVIQLSLGLCISNLILVFIIKRFVYLLLSIRNDIYFYAIIA